MNGPDWRQMPNLTALRAFEAAARLGSFAGAARALNVTPPAVAQQVRALETDLGRALFRRAGRGQELTPEGAALAARLGEAFGQIALAVAALRDQTDRQGLRITTTPAFARGSLLPRLERFWARHPDIAVSIVPDAAVVDLAREGFDLGIRAGEGPWHGVVAEPLLSTRMVLVGAPALIGRGTALQDLPWLADPRYGIERDWLAQAGLDPERLRYRPVEDMALVMDAARAGLGLLFASAEVAADDIAHGRLAEVPFPGLPAMTYRIVTAPGPRSRAVRHFIGWLRNEMGSR